MRNLLAAALFALPLAGPANAGAYSDDTADMFAAPPPRVVTHRVWSLECDPANGGPYFVGHDSGDHTVQIKTPHGRPYGLTPMPREPSRSVPVLRVSSPSGVIRTATS
jgi:hypothetical protein